MGDGPIRAGIADFARDRIPYGEFKEVCLGLVGFDLQACKDVVTEPIADPYALVKPGLLIQPVILQVHPQPDGHVHALTQLPLPGPDHRQGELVGHAKLRTGKPLCHARRHKEVHSQAQPILVISLPEVINPYPSPEIGRISYFVVFGAHIHGDVPEPALLQVRIVRLGGKPTGPEVFSQAGAHPQGKRHQVNTGVGSPCGAVRIMLQPDGGEQRKPVGDLIVGLEAQMDVGVQLRSDKLVDGVQVRVVGVQVKPQANLAKVVQAELPLQPTVGKGEFGEDVDGLGPADLGVVGQSGRVPQAVNRVTVQVVVIGIVDFSPPYSCIQPSVVHQVYELISPLFPIADQRPGLVGDVQVLLVPHLGVEMVGKEEDLY